MVQAIRFEKTGGPAVLTWRQVSVDRPGSGGRESGDVDSLFETHRAYAILRHNGVDLGKMDFLGLMKFVDG